MDKQATRILIADNVPHIRSALRVLLRQTAGVTVVGEAADAEQAISLVGSERPDVALLEWELPGQNGSSIVADLKRAQPGLRVVATSARIEARCAALAAGADGFVSKLDPPERLLEAMRECAGKTAQMVTRKGESRQ